VSKGNGSDKREITFKVPESFANDDYCPRRRALAGMKVKGTPSSGDNIAKVIFVDPQKYVGVSDPKVVGMAIFPLKSVKILKE